jgi:hypothetical protein
MSAWLAPAGATHNCSPILPMLYQYFLININALEKSSGLFAEVPCRSSAMPTLRGRSARHASRPTAGRGPQMHKPRPFEAGFVTHQGRRSTAKVTFCDGADSGANYARPPARGAAAAPGIVRPLQPPQLLEIAILKFGVTAPELGCAGESMPPDPGIRRHPTKSVERPFLGS